MKYKQALFPWVIYRLLPNLQRLTVARFRHRNDAEEHMKIIQRLLPQASFTIAFEVSQPYPRVQPTILTILE
ncbi:hypothetical protein IQ249_06920 [Lusitaniella coriacea LEGE 07157]|uniref:Uncharacterized protein n=1 Tax=Lusitaniella coriacea LEGE 07157 TaxID=945747 RepID=A0A8J7DV86_9CYAN|nr:hypothetical protein [Lusitaniella coriacea]MBE9115626.1 hypothetical protein [Lusitaniella coriacea LEGE 07157]